MKKIFVHGVPDTPFMWTPLTRALGLSREDVSVLNLPGFGIPVPEGFSSTKEEYTTWLIASIEAEAGAVGGQVDLVGHDWGALLVLRAASLRPDLVRSFVVANALIDADYSGHRMAKLWATPVIGELVMWMSRFQDMEAALVSGGMPADLAAHEIHRFDKTMRKSILALYRSAAGLSFRGSWVEDLKNLPRHGHLLWGENDPFVDLSVALRFRDRWSYPLHILPDTGHWGIIEKPEEAAEKIRLFWSGLDS
jgi:pimeloyl-ACP methyl ester carboxylesterase